MGYAMNTWFVFEDGKLVRKWQAEDKPNNASIKIDPNTRIKIDND